LQLSSSSSLIFQGGTTLGSGGTASEIRFVNTTPVVPTLTNNVIAGAFGSDSTGVGMVTTNTISPGVVNVRLLTSGEYVPTVPATGGDTLNVRTSTANSLSASNTTINSLYLAAGGSVAIAGNNMLTITSRNLILAPGNGGISGGQIISSSIYVPGIPSDVSTISTDLVYANKSGGGTLVLSAPIVGGQLSVQNGKIVLGAGLSAGVQHLLTVQSGATLDSSAQPIQVESLAGYGTIAMGSNNLTVNFDNQFGFDNFNGTITGTGSLVKTGLGTFCLSYSSSFSGPVDIQGGYFEFGAPVVNGGPVTIHDSYLYLSSTGTTSTFARNIVVSPTAVGAGIVVVRAATVNVTGSVTIPAGRTLTLNANGDPSRSSFIEFSGQITGGGGLQTIYDGNYLFSGKNNYSGGTILGSTNDVINIGIGSDTAFGTGPVTVNTTGTALFAAHGNHMLSNALTIRSDFTVASILGTYDLTFGPGSTATLMGSAAETGRTITVTSAGNFTLNSVAGSGTVQSLTKAGGGSLTLTGNNTYTGTTTIGAGSFIVPSGASLSGGGAVTVGGAASTSRAILGGGGTIAGPVTINATGTLSPGSSAGNLTLQNGLTYAAGSTHLWELAANTTGGAGTNWDRVVVTGGTLSVNSAAILLPSFIGTATAPSSSDPFWQMTQRWDNIIDLTGTAINGGGSAFIIDNTPWLSAGTFMTIPAVVGGGVALVWTPVPEPLYILLVAGAAGIGIHTWRRRSACSRSVSVA
jgi:autotransporter-associated beta strand protein